MEFNKFNFALEREIATVDVNTCIRCIFKKGIFVKKNISNPMIIQKTPEGNQWIQILNTNIYD